MRVRLRSNDSFIYLAFGRLHGEEKREPIDEVVYGSRQGMASYALHSTAVFLCRIDDAPYNSVLPLFLDPHLYSKTNPGFIIFLVMLAIFNGADYYIEVFSRRYAGELARLEEQAQILSPLLTPVKTDGYVMGGIEMVEGASKKDI